MGPPVTMIVFTAMLGWISSALWLWWYSKYGPYAPHDPLNQGSDAGKPQPVPWRLLIRVAGAVGGVGAVIVFRGEIANAGLLTTGAVALVGGAFVADVVLSVAALGAGKRAGPA